MFVFFFSVGSFLRKKRGIFKIKKNIRSKVEPKKIRDLKFISFFYIWKVFLNLKRFWEGEVKFYLRWVTLKFFKRNFIPRNKKERDRKDKVLQIFRTICGKLIWESVRETKFFEFEYFSFLFLFCFLFFVFVLSKSFKVHLISSFLYGSFP